MLRAVISAECFVCGGLISSQAASRHSDDPIYGEACVLKEGIYPYCILKILYPSKNKGIIVIYTRL